MKKVFLTLGMCLFLSVVSIAQMSENVLTNKKGQRILPQAGDFALGIDASGLLNYVGNMFNNSTENNANDIFNYKEGGVFNGTTIFGKYFLTDNTAVRARLNLNAGSSTVKVGAEDALTETKTSSTALGLLAGYELRRGYGRLQGFFGPEVGIGYSSGISRTITNHTAAGSTTTKVSGPSEFVIMAGGFAGVEYFILPKFSIGSELNLGVQYTNFGKLKTTDATGTTIETNGSNSFNFGIGYSGLVNVTFYF